MLTRPREPLSRRSLTPDMVEAGLHEHVPRDEVGVDVQRVGF